MDPHNDPAFLRAEALHLNPPDPLPERDDIDPYDEYIDMCLERGYDPHTGKPQDPSHDRTRSL